jgi:hypothetical protein
MITRHDRLQAIVALGALSAALGGCGSKGDDPSTGHADAIRREREEASLTAPASSPKRQILHHAPFGHVAASHNVVLDGDFELELGQGAPIWTMTNADGSLASSLFFQSGGHCRSGLYCADAQGGQTLTNGFVPVPPGAAGRLTLVAKPSSGACADVHAEIDLGTTTDGTVYDAFVAQPASPTPAPDGWCTYATAFTADRPLYQWTQVTLTSESETLFDDVVAVEDPAAHVAALSARSAGDPARGRAYVAHHRPAPRGSILADRRPHALAR